MLGEIMISADVQGAIAALGRLSDTQIPAFALALADQLSLEALSIEQEQTPVGRYPPGSGRSGGGLRASEGIRTTPRGMEVGPHKDYAVFVFRGTKFMESRPIDMWAGAETLARAPEIVDLLADKMLKAGEK